VQMKRQIFGALGKCGFNVIQINSAERMNAKSKR